MAGGSLNSQRRLRGAGLWLATEPLRTAMLDASDTLLETAPIATPHSTLLDAAAESVRDLVRTVDRRGWPYARIELATIAFFPPLQRLGQGPGHPCLISCWAAFRAGAALLLHGTDPALNDLLRDADGTRVDDFRSVDPLAVLDRIESSTTNLRKVGTWV